MPGPRPTTVNGSAMRQTPPHEQNRPAFLAHIVFAAARCCIYWGKRGHWLNP